MEAFLVGECGKTEREAALTSAHEFRLLQDGKQRETREKWEMLRWMMWQHVKMSPHIKNKPNSPQQYLRFPWEKTQKEEVEEKFRNSKLSEGQIAELNRIFEDFNKRHKEKS